MFYIASFAGVLRSNVQTRKAGDRKEKMIFSYERRGFIYWTSKCHIFHWRLFYNYCVLISLIKRRQVAYSEDQNTSLQKRTFCYIVATAHIIYVGCNVHVA